ncbi:type III restriction-modification system, Mod subunit, partial [Bacillus cereus SJ1]
NLDLQVRGRSSTTFARKHDTIFWFAKTDNYFFNKDEVRMPVTNESTTHNYRYVDSDGRRYREDIRKNGKVYRYYLDEGKIPEDSWTDIDSLHHELAERLEYPTQKPEALLRRIIKSATRKGDLVADFFVGSGTTAAVAEKLGRRWIATDLGKFGIHTTRKRLIGVQRELKAAEKD